MLRTMLSALLTVILLAGCNLPAANNATQVPSARPPTATPAVPATSTTAPTPVPATPVPSARAPATSTRTSQPPTGTPGSGTCSPVNATISAPFTQDGTGSFCWRSSNLGSYVNSWNLAKLTINGVDFTNKWASSSQYPAKASDGYWYIAYSSSVAWGHFEAR